LRCNTNPTKTLKQTAATHSRKPRQKTKAKKSKQPSYQAKRNQKHGIRPGVDKLGPNGVFFQAR
jgi:hypothetical protein